MFISSFFFFALPPTSLSHYQKPRVLKVKQNTFEHLWSFLHIFEKLFIIIIFKMQAI